MQQKPNQFFRTLVLVTSVVAGFFVAAAIPHADAAWTRTDLAGTYRCWSFNANGRGGKCTSPPIVLNKNGKYTMSSERGTYTIKGDTVVFSKSKFRGAGKILEEGMQIQFSYIYKGSQQTMTFLRQTPAAASVVLELTIKYPSEDALGWVNTVQLIPQGKKVPTYDAIAYNDTNDKKILKAYWKKGVPGGKMYDVYTGTGFNNEQIGILDLTKVKAKTFKKTITVPSLPTLPTPPTQGGAGQAEGVGTPTSPTESIGATPNQNLPLCNPSIPRYAQPACKE